MTPCCPICTGAPPEINIVAEKNINYWGLFQQQSGRIMIEYDSF